MDGSPEIVYRINDRDEITFVSESWDRFADQNAGDAVLSARVLHHSLWDFIADATTRELYRQVLVRIRAGTHLSFTFRCDSPACRRLLEMTVERHPEGGVVFRSRTLSVEDRPAQPLLGVVAGGDGALLRICSWCKRVDVHGRWAEVEDAVRELGLLEAAQPPGITHGICEDCYRQIEAAVAAA